jgi:acyl-CoA reductase-like NAD-dependent aldehyde dehydrogenase
MVPYVSESERGTGIPQVPPGRLPSPFDRLTADDAAVLSRRAVPVEFSAGSCIFEAGTIGDCCYVIDSGVVRIDVDRSELPADSGIDDETALAYVEAGDLLGELALLDQLPRSASAYAYTDVRARRIDAALLNEFTRTRPVLAVALYSALGRAAALRLRRMTTRLALPTLANEPEAEGDSDVDDTVARATAAQSSFLGWSEDMIDELLRSMASAVADHAEELARANVEEAGFGSVESKIGKILMLSLGAYSYLAGRRAAGAVAADPDLGLTEFAGPVGVVFGLGPVTNPVSTLAFKALICVKSRNALVFSPHHMARNVSLRVEELLRGALEAHGAPADLIQCVRTRASRAKTVQFMEHPNVALVLATGGQKMVKVAYSSGTPAIGVGPGNTPALVCGDADLPSTVEKILLSKTFDNGVICGAENNLVVVDAVYDAFVAEAERQGAAVLSPEEAADFSAQLINPATNRVRGDIVGQPASLFAQFGGIKRTFPIELVIVPSSDIGPDNPYAHEKLAPLLSLFRAADEEDGIIACQELLAIAGAGHTAAIHTSDEATISRFAEQIPASRILVNSPAAHGIIGMTTGLIPTATLGCGTYGGTSTTDNVTYTHLLNIKRLARYLPEKAAAWAEMAAGPAATVTPSTQAHDTTGAP